MSKESDRNWLRKHAALEDGGFVSVGGFISTLETELIDDLRGPDSNAPAFRLYESLGLRGSMGTYRFS